MEQAVWKFPIDLLALDAKSHTVIKMPEASQVLYATNQGDNAVLYALVHSRFRPVLARCHVWVFGTGHPIIDIPAEARPAGVVKIREDRLVFHVFYMLDTFERDVR